MPVEINDLESRRFGIIAGRVTDAAATPAEVDRAAQAQHVRMLTLRLGCEQISRVQAFEDAGYRLMDTLVYFGRDLHNLPRRPPVPEHLSIRLADAVDAAAVGEVARAGFTGYIGHYHADARLDRSSADAAYIDWAETSTARTSLATPVLVVESEAKVVGFLALRRNSGEEMEIVLNAVEPSHQGRGAYSALVSEAMALGLSCGCSTIITSTQIINYRVQRVWARLGFIHSRSVYTLHKWF